MHGGIERDTRGTGGHAGDPRDTRGNGGKSTGESEQAVKPEGPNKNRCPRTGLTASVLLINV
jgi:hypothetical protein